MKKDQIDMIEDVVGYKFSDASVLDVAFTHSSAVSQRVDCNERFEFLGDSVLGLVICRCLFHKFSDYDEGDLTKMKSLLVSRKMCAQISKRLELKRFLKIGKGMENCIFPDSVYAGTYEAVVAAIYLDGGFKAAQNFIEWSFKEEIETINAKQSHGNYKSILQQYAQQQINTTPSYEVLDEKGPDHNKCFELEVMISGKHFKSAWSNTKKEAEQKAAYNALVELGVIEPEQIPD